MYGLRVGMKLPFWGTLLTLGGVAVLCALGYWQVERMAWKQQILERLEHVYAQDAAVYALADKDFSEVVTKENLYVFKRGFISGHFINEKTILISPKVFKGKVGAHVITPFEIENGRQIILVNRGWIPQEGQQMLKEAGLESGGRVKIEGMVRSAPERNVYTPQNVPEKGQWYFLDVAQIAQYMGLQNVFSHILVLEGIEGVKSEYPIVEGARLEISNNHAQYAVFWFSMAVVLIIVFSVRFVARK